MLNLILGIISLILQAVVVYYGYRLYNILNPVRYWSHAWLLYTTGNLLILIRRAVGLFLVGCTTSVAVTLENVIQIAVSVLLLVFGWTLSKMYSKYFTDGLNIQSWKEEQANIIAKGVKDIVDQHLADNIRGDCDACPIAATCPLNKNVLAFKEEQAKKQK